MEYHAAVQIVIQLNWSCPRSKRLVGSNGHSGRFGEEKDFFPLSGIKPNTDSHSAPCPNHCTEYFIPVLMAVSFESEIEDGISLPAYKKLTSERGLYFTELKTYIYTGCPRRNVPDFGRVFLMLKYADITQNTYVQS